MGEMRRMACSLLLTTVLFACALGAPALASAQFGVASFNSSFSTSQAGAHGDFTTGFSLQTGALGNPDGQLRDAEMTLPAGLVGNSRAIETCSVEALDKFDCQPAAQVGTLGLTIVACRGNSSPLQASAGAGAQTLTVANSHAFCTEGAGSSITVGEGASAEKATVASIVNSTTIELEAPLELSHSAGEVVTHIANTNTGSLPLFNMQPSPGHVATFATSLLITNIFVQINVGADGRLTATIGGASTLAWVQASSLTLWGLPAAASHDSLRCAEPLGDPCNLPPGPPAAFMTNPTACPGSPMQAGLNVTSWEGQSDSSVSELPPMTGCESLSMAPAMTVAPSTVRRDSPAGYEVTLNVPQSESPDALATPALEGVSVELPQGTSLSPGLANGLQACERTQLTRGSCPDASRVGSAEAVSPLLGEPLKGSLYIGVPTLTEPYPLFMELSGEGVDVDLFGKVQIDAETGQVTAVFEHAPELPVQQLRLSFFGGPTAALANPAQCGPARSNATIASYAGQVADLSSTFDISEDSGGGPCPSASPFAPGFAAGVSDTRAGHSSPFTLTVSRADGQQYLSSFAAHLPAGLVGLVKSVPPCPEPAAATGACTQASQVGTATVAAGAGALPLYVSGPVYLTGPYGAAPFGLDIVIKASTGPFDLGTALIRSRISFNPSDLALTIASDPIPQTLGGIPLRVRMLNVSLDRPGFLVNPTSCAAGAVTATIGSSAGTGVDVSTPFQATDCAALSFTPHLSASTQAKASLQGDGAGLKVDIVNPPNAGTTVHSVVIQMPKQLRPRLGTIQHACMASAQMASVTACPAVSRVGEVTVSSPVTGAPLSGPIYLLAHGGPELPSLLVLLQGEGIDVELEGSLRVSSRGIISAAFTNLPDIPISSFELALPRGPHSMLGAVASLCTGHLGLPYALTDQSGAQAKGAARIAVSGCPRRTARGKRARAGLRAARHRGAGDRRRVSPGSRRGGR